MIQARFDWWFSLGIHLDFKRRRMTNGGTYGPYLDLHLGCLIVSLGNNPVYSGMIEADSSTSRGGIRAE